MPNTLYEDEYAQFAHPDCNYSIFTIENLRDEVTAQLTGSFKHFLTSSMFKNGSIESRWNLMRDKAESISNKIVADSDKINKEDKKRVSQVVLEEVKNAITADKKPEIEEEVKPVIEKFDTVRIVGSEDEYIVDNILDEYAELHNFDKYHLSNLEVVSKYEYDEDIEYVEDQVVKYDDELTKVSKVEGTSLVLSNGEIAEIGHPNLEHVAFPEYKETDLTDPRIIDYKEGFEIQASIDNDPFNLWEPEVEWDTEACEEFEVGDKVLTSVASGTSTKRIPEKTAGVVSFVEDTLIEVDFGDEIGKEWITASDLDKEALDETDYQGSDGSPAVVPGVNDDGVEPVVNEEIENEWQEQCTEVLKNMGIDGDVVEFILEDGCSECPCDGDETCPKSEAPAEELEEVVEEPEEELDEVDEDVEEIEDIQPTPDKVKDNSRFEDRYIGASLNARQSKLVKESIAEALKEIESYTSLEDFNQARKEMYGGYSRDELRDMGESVAIDYSDEMEDAGANRYKIYTKRLKEIALNSYPDLNESTLEKVVSYATGSLYQWGPDTEDELANYEAQFEGRDDREANLIKESISEALAEIDEFEEHPNTNCDYCGDPISARKIEGQPDFCSEECELNYYKDNPVIDEDVDEDNYDTPKDRNEVSDLGPLI